MARKPRNHVRMLIYRTWAISYRMQKKVKEKQLNLMFTEMTLDSIKLVTCGSGNGAHAFAGIFCCFGPRACGSVLLTTQESRRAETICLGSKLQIFQDTIVSQFPRDLSTKKTKPNIEN